MTHLTVGDLAWAAAVLAAIAVFWLPVIIVAARQVDRIGLVVLLTLLGLATGVLWFAALWAAVILPRRDLPGPGRQPGAWSAGFRQWRERTPSLALTRAGN